MYCYSYSIRLLEHKISIAIVRTFAYNKDKSVQMENSDSEGGLVDYDR